MMDAKAPPDQSARQVDDRRWKITACPGCQRGQLHRGVLRGHCEFCFVYFSVDDERPDRLTAREARRYPMHGVPVEVVPASERDRLAGEVERLRAALDLIVHLTAGDTRHHRVIGRDCGHDVCAVCVIDSTAREALAPASDDTHASKGSGGVG